MASLPAAVALLAVALVASLLAVEWDMDFHMALGM